MSGPCARIARLCGADGKNTSTGYSKSHRVKKSFRISIAQDDFRAKILSKVARLGRTRRLRCSEFRSALLGRRQREFRPQPADRRAAKGEAAAVQGRKINHDRQAQA